MNNKHEICSPNPEATIESIRSLGYDLNIATSDLIDNSISANAKNIWVLHKWDAENSSFIIYDEGRGMDEDELFKAMALGSTSPTIERDPKDLGRFGLGLKVASWSQCRVLTVATKKENGELNIRKWDLDFVSKKNEWLLMKETDDESLKIINKLIENHNSGSVVLLQNLDRLLSIDVNDLVESEQFFYEKISLLKKYLSMVFHRYLTGPNAINIHVSNLEECFQKGKKLKPWDPFMEKNTNTIPIGEEKLKFKDSSISVSPFVLPHHSKFKSDQAFREAGGINGWNVHQGFYVYRQRRMIMHGGWMGFRKAEDHYKLARIRLDIPNSMDTDWKIGVKKIAVTPPDFFKKELKRIVKITTEKAGKVYRFRGKLNKVGNPKIKEIVWKMMKKGNGEVSYKIERKHPVVKSILASSKNKKELNALITMIEKTIPVETIIVNDRENPNSHIHSKHSSEEDLVPLKKWYDEHMDFLTKGNRMSREEAFEKLITMEPFNLYLSELEVFRGSENNE